MGKYVWPCPSYSRISSGYGNRTCPFHGKEFHDGVDLAAASGAPILAFGPGTVTKSGWYGGYGNYISIDHGGGLMSFYGHASALYVKQGAKVTAGQKIAAVGTTGSSTGCHLHFGMHKNGSSVNPLNYVSSGDTLWDIAKEYRTEEYSDISSYIAEVREINHLSSNQITDGMYLCIPYYSEEYKS